MQGPLPSECPRCRSQMGRGFVRVNSALLWSQPPGVLIGAPLTVAPWTIEEFPGFRCSNCKLLILDYSEFAERRA